MKKRVLAFLLCICMVATLLPAMSLPAAAASTVPVKEAELSKLGFKTSTEGVEAQIANAELPNGKSPFSLTTLSELYVTRGNEAGRIFEGAADTSKAASYNCVAGPQNATFERSAALDVYDCGKNTCVAQTYAIVMPNDTTQLWLRVVDVEKAKQGAATHFFTLPFIITATQASAYISLATGDYDGDGKDEIAVYLPVRDISWSAGVRLYECNDELNLRYEDKKELSLRYDVQKEEGEAARYKYLSVDLATARHPNERCDDLVATTNFPRYCPYEPELATSRVFMWSDPLTPGKRESSAVLAWDWKSTYGVTQSGYENYREQMMFAGVDAGDLDNDFYDEVVVGGYRREYADKTSGSWYVSNEELMVTYYKYNPADRTYAPAMKGAQWLSINGDDYKGAIDIAGGIWNASANWIDYATGPLQVTCFAERGAGFGESALVGGLVVGLNINSCPAGTGQGFDGLQKPYPSKYMAPDNLLVSGMSNFAQSGFMVRYAVPLMTCEYTHASSVSSTAIVDAVAGNFSNNVKVDPTGKEQLVLMYDTLVSSTSRYYTHVCTLKFLGSGEAPVNHKDSEKDAAGYWTFPVENVSFTQSAEIVSESRSPVSISAPDIDKDSVLMRYDTTKDPTWYFSDPNIIAVLQAAPYFGELVTTGYTEDTGETAISNSSGSSTGTSQEVALSAGPVTGFDQHLSFLIDLAEVALEIQVTFNVGYSYEYESSITHSLGFSAVSTDTVALSMTPYVRYYYEMWDPINGVWKPVTQDMPNIPQITQVTVDKYDAIAEAAGWTTIRDNVLNNSQPGDPNSYYKTAPNSTWSAGKTPGAAVSTGGFVNLGSGDGSVTLGIDAEQSASHGITWGAAVDTTWSASIFGGKCGCTAGVEYSGGYSWGSTVGSSYSGTIADISDALSADFDFDWSFGSWTTDLGYTDNNGKQVVQNCIVLGYLVRNVQSMPRAPIDLNIQAVTSRDLTLSWSPTSGAQYYAIYRYLPDSRIYYQLGTVEALADPAEDFTYTYKDEGLEPATNYIYSVRAFGYKDGRLRSGLYSPLLSGRTNPEGAAVPQIARQPEDKRAPVGATAIFDIEVKRAPGGDAPTYQWQEYKADGWQDMKNATDSKLTISKITTRDNGALYRCLVIQRVRGTVHVLYSAAAELTIGSVGTTTTLAVLDKPGTTQVTKGPLETTTTEDVRKDVPMAALHSTEKYTMIRNVSGNIFLKKEGIYYTVDPADNEDVVKKAGEAIRHWILAMFDPDYDIPLFVQPVLTEAPIKIVATPAVLEKEGVDEVTLDEFNNVKKWKVPGKSSAGVPDPGYDDEDREFDGTNIVKAANYQVRREVASPYRIIYTVTSGAEPAYYLKTADAYTFTKLDYADIQYVQGGTPVPNFAPSQLAEFNVPMEVSETVTKLCDPIMLRATVAVSNDMGGIAPPSGTVSFHIASKDSGAPLRLSAPLKTVEGKQVAELLWTPTEAGLYNITSTYTGNAVLTTSASEASSYEAYREGFRLVLETPAEPIYPRSSVTVTPMLCETKADGTVTKTAVTGASINYRCTKHDVIKKNFPNLVNNGETEGTLTGNTFTPQYGAPYVLTATYTDSTTHITYTASRTLAVQTLTLVLNVKDQAKMLSDLKETGAAATILSTDNLVITDANTGKPVEAFAMGTALRAEFFNPAGSLQEFALYAVPNQPKGTLPDKIGSYTLSLAYFEKSTGAMLSGTMTIPILEDWLKYFVYTHLFSSVPGTLNLTDTQCPVTFGAEANGALQAAVAMDGDGSGELLQIESGQKVAENKEVLFSAVPAVGYRVSHWTVDGEIVRDSANQNRPVTAMELKRTVAKPTEAHVAFSTGNYTLTYSVAADTGTLKAQYDNASGVEIPSGTTMATMKPVYFTADPANTVTGWTVNGVAVQNPDGTDYLDSHYTLTNAAEDTVVTVSFADTAETFTVKAIGMDQYGNPIGDVLVSPALPDTGKVEKNTALTFTAVPPAGYTLTKWCDGDGKLLQLGTAGSSYRVANVLGNLEIRAIFEAPQKFYVRWVHMVNSTAIEAKTGPTVLTTPNIEYEKGIPLTFTVTPSDGYKVTEWKINDVAVAEPNVVADNVLTVPALSEDIVVTYTCGKVPTWKADVGKLLDGSQGKADDTWDLATLANVTGAATYTLASGSELPAGLTLEPAGTIRGTPAAAGDFTFTVRVTDTVGSADQAFTLHVKSKDTAVKSVTVNGRATAIDPANAANFICTLPVGAVLDTITKDLFAITPCTGASAGECTTAGAATGIWKFTVTAENGTTKEYTVTLTVATEFFPVENITSVPTKTLVNLPLTLIGTTIPATATNQTIAWSIDGNSALKDPDAAIDPATGVLTANKAGTVTVKATITAGISEAVSEVPAKDYTKTFKITVTEPTIAPATKTIGLGETATFTVTAASDAPLTYQWKQSANGTDWTDIPGATTKSYTTNAAATAGTTHYKCVLSHGGGALPTELTATLTVKAATRFTLTVVDGSISGSRSITASGEYLPDDVVTLVAAAAPAGKVFSKWTATLNENTFTTPLQTTTDYTMPDAEVTVTANYVDKPVDPNPGGGGGGGGGGGQTEKLYTLTFATGDGSAVAPLSVKEAEEVLLSAYTSTRTNFTFDGWYADMALTKPISTITLTEDTTIYAKWTPVRELPFTDVTADDWFKKAVEYVYLHDIMQGITGSEFSPYLTTTRGMIVTVLWRMEGQPAATAVDAFPDLTADWYRAAVDWAAEFDIVLGYENGNFGPLDNITREQMAAIFYRYAKYKGYDVTATADLSQFSDLAMVSQYAVPAMRWTIGAGLLQGDNGKLMPRDDANRAQLATILHRFCENLAKQK